MQRWELNLYSKNDKRGVERNIYEKNNRKEVKLMKKSSKKMNEKELNFLKAELKRTDDQIGHYSYGGREKTLDKVTELFKLRKIIMKEIKIIEEEEIKIIEEEEPKVGFI